VIFLPAEVVALIAQRRKTMTRRIIGEQAECPYRTGRAYQVQAGHGGRGLFPITITASRAEALGEISFKDVKREGHATTADFAQQWFELYGDFDPGRPVWVISFAWGDLTDQPRLLASRPGAPHGDYVADPHRAMRSEPEALSSAQLVPLTREAQARDRARATGRLKDERNQIAQSLAAMREHLAQEPDREISRTVRALEHQLSSLDRKLVG